LQGNWHELKVFEMVIAAPLLRAVRVGAAPLLEAVRVDDWSASSGSSPIFWSSQQLAIFADLGDGIEYLAVVHHAVRKWMSGSATRRAGQAYCDILLIIS
jgi:hypothetical protein